MGQSALAAADCSSQAHQACHLFQSLAKVAARESAYCGVTALYPSHCCPFSCRATLFEAMSGVRLAESLFRRGGETLDNPFN